MILQRVERVTVMVSLGKADEQSSFRSAFINQAERELKSPHVLAKKMASIRIGTFGVGGAIVQCPEHGFGYASQIERGHVGSTVTQKRVR